MSGLEAVGIVASISQLLQYSGQSILILQDICQNATQSAKRYRRHHLKVQQVIQIAELISATEGLQSVLILSHLASLIDTTKSIKEAIEKTLLFAGPEKKLKKCLKILDVQKADSAIFRGFDDLERDKSCLTLCLLGSYGSLIVGILCSVEKIPGKLESMQKSLKNCSEVAEESRRIKENIVVLSEHGICSSCGSEQRSMHESVPQDLVQIGARAVHPDNFLIHERRVSEVSEDDTVGLSHDNQLDMNSHSEEENSNETSGEHSWYGGGCTYSEITACDQASQINGSFGFSPSDGLRGHSSWFNVRATGKSNQWNGDIKDASILAGFFWPRGS